MSNSSVKTEACDVSKTAMMRVALKIARYELYSAIESYLVLCQSTSMIFSHSAQSQQDAGINTNYTNHSSLVVYDINVFLVDVL